MEQRAFVGAVKEVFGFKSGQTLKDFAVEVKQLTDGDRRELALLLSKELGVNVSDGLTTPESARKEK